MRSRTSTQAEPETTEPTPEIPPVVADGARPARRRTATEPTAKSVPPETSKPAEPTAKPEQRPIDNSPLSVENLKMGVGFDVLVETMFEFDAEQAYARVKQSIAALTRSDRSDYGSLVNALDEAAEASALALQLSMNARVARDTLEVEAQVIESALRDRARAALQNSGIAKPTIADIEARMSADWHDEVRALTERRSKARELANGLEGLARIASERQRDLRQMVSGASKV